MSQDTPDFTPFSYNEKDLIQARQEDGAADGEVVQLGRPWNPREPQLIHPNSTFKAKLPIPPLHRPEVEVLLEGCRGEEGEYWRAQAADKEVKIGPHVQIQLKHLAAVGASREEATKKLSALVGHAAVQVYVTLVTSGDENKIRAGRSMEIASAADRGNLDL